MTYSEYLKNAFDALNAGKISDDVYDAMVRNIDIFCESDEEEEDD